MERRSGRLLGDGDGQPTPLATVPLAIVLAATVEDDRSMSTDVPAPAPNAPHETDPASGIDPNLLTAYALWAVFRRPVGAVTRGDDESVAELDAVVAAGAERGVTIRGFYDVKHFT